MTALVVEAWFGDNMIYPIDHATLGQAQLRHISCALAILYRTTGWFSGEHHGLRKLLRKEVMGKGSSVKKHSETVRVKAWKSIRDVNKGFVAVFTF